jgi:hypothetical protein
MITLSKQNCNFTAASMCTKCNNHNLLAGDASNQRNQLSDNTAPKTKRLNSCETLTTNNSNAAAAKTAKNRHQQQQQQQQQHWQFGRKRGPYNASTRKTHVKLKHLINNTGLLLKTASFFQILVFWGAHKLHLLLLIFFSFFSD